MTASGVESIENKKNRMRYPKQSSLCLVQSPINHSKKLFEKKKIFKQGKSLSCNINTSLNNSAERHRQKVNLTELSASHHTSLQSDASKVKIK